MPKMRTNQQGTPETTTTTTTKTDSLNFYRTRDEAELAPREHGDLYFFLDKNELFYFKGAAREPIKFELQNLTATDKFLSFKDLETYKDFNENLIGEAQRYVESQGESSSTVLADIKKANGIVPYYLYNIITNIIKNKKYNDLPEVYRDLLKIHCKKQTSLYVVKHLKPKNNPQHTNVILVDVSTPPEFVIPHDEDERITIGDMHGSDLTDTYYLMLHGLIEKNDKLYSELAAAFEKDDEKYKALQKKLVGTGSKNDLLYLGDKFSDRRGSDEYNLFKLELMDTQLGIPPEKSPIIISNHDIPFIRGMEMLIKDFEAGNFSLKKDYFSAEILKLRPDQCVSAIRLGNALKAGKIKVTELIRLYKNHYLPRLEVIEYTLFDKGIDYDIHARPPALELMLMLLAKQFGIRYKGDTNADIAKTIHAINRVFQNEYVKKDRISELYDLKCAQVLDSKYEKNEEIDDVNKGIILKKYLRPKYAFTLATNNRLSLQADEKDFKQNRGFTLSCTYGHDIPTLKVLALPAEYFNPLNGDTWLDDVQLKYRIFFQSLNNGIFLAFSEEGFYKAFINEQGLEEIQLIPFSKLPPKISDQFLPIIKARQKEFDDTGDWDNSAIDFDANIWNIAFKDFPEFLMHDKENYSCLDNKVAKPTRTAPEKSTGNHLFSSRPIGQRVDLTPEEFNAMQSDDYDIAAYLENIDDRRLFKDEAQVHLDALPPSEKHMIGNFGATRYDLSKGGIKDYKYGPNKEFRISVAEIQEDQKTTQVIIDETNFIAHLPDCIDQTGKSVGQLYYELITLRDYCIDNDIPLPALTSLNYTVITSTNFLMMSSLPYRHKEFVKEKLVVITQAAINLNCNTLPGNAVELGYVEGATLAEGAKYYDTSKAYLTDKFTLAQRTIIDLELKSFFSTGVNAVVTCMSGTGSFAGLLGDEAKKRYAKNFVESFLALTQELDSGKIPHIYFSAKGKESRELIEAIQVKLEEAPKLKNLLSCIHIHNQDVFAIASVLNRETKGLVAVKNAGDVLKFGGLCHDEAELSLEGVVINRTTAEMTQDIDLNPERFEQKDCYISMKDIMVEDIKTAQSSEKEPASKGKLTKLTQGDLEGMAKQLLAKAGKKPKEQEQTTTTTTAQPKDETSILTQKITKDIQGQVKASAARLFKPLEQTTTTTTTTPQVGFEFRPIQAEVNGKTQVVAIEIRSLPKEKMGEIFYGDSKGYYDIVNYIDTFLFDDDNSVLTILPLALKGDACLEFSEENGASLVFPSDRDVVKFANHFAIEPALVQDKKIIFPPSFSQGHIFKTTPREENQQTATTTTTTVPQAKVVTLAEQTNDPAFRKAYFAKIDAFFTSYSSTSSGGFFGLGHKQIPAKFVTDLQRIKDSPTVAEKQKIMLMDKRISQFLNDILPKNPATHTKTTTVMQLDKADSLTEQQKAIFDYLPGIENYITTPFSEKTPQEKIKTFVDHYNTQKTTSHESVVMVKKIVASNYDPVLLPDFVTTFLESALRKASTTQGTRSKTLRILEDYGFLNGHHHSLFKFTDPKGDIIVKVNPKAEKEAQQTVLTIKF